MADKSSIASKRAARTRAETVALTEVRHAAEKQREKTEKLRQLRLERDAASPAKKKKAVARRTQDSGLNLAQTQRLAKK